MTWHHFKQQYLVRFWSPVPAVIAAGVLAAYYFGLTGTFWAVTGEFTRWGGHVLQAFGVDVSDWGYFRIIGIGGTPLTRVDGVMIIGMFAGSLAAALWADNVKLRWPKHRVRVFQAITGGIVAGFGARLAMGCNLAAFFTGIPQFSLHAWLFMVSMALGSLAGAKFSLLPLFRTPVRLQQVTAPLPLADRGARARRHLRLGLLLAVGYVLWASSMIPATPKLGFAALFGLAFGILIERGQVCFTSAFRDLWITGRSQLAKAIIAGMAVSAVGIYSYIQLGMEPKIFWAGPNAVIGGLLFGFGIVLAGGCETGWMYRAMEGQLHFWIVGLGNIIGATLLALVWDDLAPVLVTGFERVNLLEAFGPYGGLLLTAALLGLSLGFVLWWERRFFARRAVPATVEPLEPAVSS